MREIYAFLGGFGHFWTLWAVHWRIPFAQSKVGPIQVRPWADLDAIRMSMDGVLARSTCNTGRWEPIYLSSRSRATSNTQAPLGFREKRNHDHAQWARAWSALTRTHRQQFPSMCVPNFPWRMGISYLGCRHFNEGAADSGSQVDISTSSESVMSELNVFPSSHGALLSQRKWGTN